MDNHEIISRQSVDSCGPAALLPDSSILMDGGPISQELPLCPALNVKPSGLENGEDQWVSEDTACFDFPLEKNKKYICAGLVSGLLSTSGFNACPCLSEVSDSFSWDLATSKGDAGII